jgi:nucleotide-binding universal stress UspA family protein
MNSDRTRFDRILIPLDGSPAAEQALAYAQGVAGTGTDVTLLRVLPEPEEISDLHDHLAVVVDEGWRRLHQFARQDLHRATDCARPCLGRVLRRWSLRESPPR